MRLAFVLRLGSDSRPDKGFLEGWIEEVDTFTEIRFHSTEELLKFLNERLTSPSVPLASLPTLRKIPAASIETRCETLRPENTDFVFRKDHEKV